ncbi:MAG: 2-C-methyl-D-erythritol 2,4-cyclodiphosphate synthase [Nitrospirae bacterium]|nr:MAG: 2-C-methyl-D-erythritol 2,4-cyclodiphosphate synthase [Nitrospirota bacterium]
MKLRVGLGYDSHRFAPQRKLILAGVEIPHEYGLAGHSDADVLTHAIIDALFGASGLDDIGTHFPDTDPKYKDISSIELLKETLRMLQGAGVQVVNVDVTVILERPKLRPYVPRMLENLRSAGLRNVNIKAKTNEGMGFIGRAEGVVAMAVALVKLPDQRSGTKQGAL